MSTLRRGELDGPYRRAYHHAFARQRAGRGRARLRLRGSSRPRHPVGRWTAMSERHRCLWLDKRRRHEKARRRLANARYKGRRTDLPRRIERPLDLSDFDQFFTEEWLLTTLQAQHFWPLIEDATKIHRPEGATGRPALEGSWALWMPLFVFTKDLSMTAFLKRVEAK